MPDALLGGLGDVAPRSADAVEDMPSPKPRANSSGLTWDGLDFSLFMEISPVIGSQRGFFSPRGRPLLLPGFWL
jgi:hypothetical protein